jgi:hypothetical protein
MTREGNMPGDPDECRLKAAHCVELVQTAVPSECEAFLTLAETWKRLAAECEADTKLLQTLGQLHLGSEPYEALLLALNIRPTGK